MGPDVVVVGILLDDSRVDPNSGKDDGETTSHVAARLNRLGAVRLLLSRGGIRLDIESNRGDSVKGSAERERHVYKINTTILDHGLAE